jgi:hypothetical protein
MLALLVDGAAVRRKIADLFVDLPAHSITENPREVIPSSALVSADSLDGS